jgi:hypothetical protein
MLVVLLSLWMIPASQAKADMLQSAITITMISPGDCPSSGCAPGQRLNVTLDFDILEADYGRSPNLQVCIFQPSSWPTSGPIEFAEKGTISDQPYTANVAHCNQPPANYTVIGGAVTTIPLSAASYDILPIAFRLSTPPTNSPYKVEIYELDVNNDWVLTSEGSQSIPVAASATTVYVANNATTCGTYAPCYLNTRDDLANGIGTGLKDAIDFSSSATTIHILGDYVIKQNSVLVDKPHTLKSIASGKIITASSTCTQPMLTLTTGANLNGLAIDGSRCTSPRRDLVQINSANPVRIESSDLVGGKDAIKVLATNTGKLTVQNNQIANNSGYAILLDSANTGVLDAQTNNLVDNQSSVQVECGGAAHGTVDHNFWGVGLSVAQSTAHCTNSETKRLGASILHNSDGPGVQVQHVNVGTTVQYQFNNAIGYQRTGSGDDFGIVIVNHGADSVNSIPFTIGQASNLQPCSNYWDIFLSSSPIPVNPATLELFFKYNLNSGCIAAVEAAQYCGQTNTPANYPLWWYDLSSGTWKTTAATGGQTTTCRTDTDEIQVSISGTTNRPSFNDLGHEPFVVGVPGTPPSVILASLTAQPGNTQANLQWVTTGEFNLTGFFVQRSTQATTGFADISAQLPRQGTGTGGSSYQYTDSNLTNGTPYYYRLRVVGTNESSIYSGVVVTTPIPQTPTPTLTLAPTLTPTYNPYTSTITRFPTSTVIYHTSTRTPTVTATPTSPFKTITSTFTSTPTSLTRTTTYTPTGLTPTLTEDPSTALAQTRAMRTQIVQLSATATASITPTAPPHNDLEVTPPTIAMSLLALATLAAGGIYLIREQRSSIK